MYNLEHNLRLANVSRPHKHEGKIAPAAAAEEQSNDLPYEFRALEAILASVLEALHIELEGIRQLVFALLASLDHNIDREKLRALLAYRRKVGDLLSRSRGVKGAVAEVLESDEDMALMHLTDAARGHPRTAQSLAWQYDSLELLLESFDKQLEEVISYTEQMQSNIGGTQEIVELILDSNRNQLLALELHVSIATLGFTGGALIASFFGMNLHTGLENNPIAFTAVCVSALVVVVTFSAVGMRRIRNIQRIGLGRARRSPLLMPVMSLRQPSTASWSQAAHAQSESRTASAVSSGAGGSSASLDRPESQAVSTPFSSQLQSLWPHSHMPPPRTGWWHALRSRMPTGRFPNLNSSPRMPPTLAHRLAADTKAADCSGAPATPSPATPICSKDGGRVPPIKSAPTPAPTAHGRVPAYGVQYAHVLPPRGAIGKSKAWLKTLFFGPEPVDVPYTPPESLDVAYAAAHAPGPFARQDVFPDYSADLIGAGYSSNRWGSSRASKRAAANERQQQDKHERAKF